MYFVNNNSVSASSLSVYFVALKRVLVRLYSVQHWWLFECKYPKTMTKHSCSCITGSQYYDNGIRCHSALSILSLWLQRRMQRTSGWGAGGVGWVLRLGGHPEIPHSIKFLQIVGYFGTFLVITETPLLELWIHNGALPYGYWLLIVALG